MAVDPLDALLARRCHGAANIRGIRFQVRYSVLRCAQLAAEQRRGDAAGATIRLEGLEDLDALGGGGGKGTLVITTIELVQVKSSAAGWSWSRLCEPVSNFLEAMRNGEEPTFRLVFDFEPKGKLAELKALHELSAAARDRVAAHFRMLVNRVGGTSGEADQLLERMALESLLEDELRRRMCAALFEASGTEDMGALDALESILAAKALAWAAERKTVGAPDVLEALRVAVEGIQHAERYQAVERRWVGPVEYIQDAVPSDFYDGKHTRLGHVVGGLDVRRPLWLERIRTAFTAAPVCAVRGPSGHGKSTLAFRYACDNWPASQTINVRSAGVPEEVAAVSDYIRFRAALGAPVHVLIDANYDTRRWAEVAQVAAALGAQTLVTVRPEDWHRYDLAALTLREVLEPTLDLREANEIFASFKARGRVHPSIRSGVHAYEQLRPPHLLLEFVHLLTQGRMLEERLRDQVRAFAAMGEDPAKKRLLRLVSLANALGAPVQVAEAMRAVQLRDDPQDVIGAMIGEYIELQDGLLVALHRLRSEHLSRILHEGGIPSMTETAMEALGMIPAESLPVFIANAFLQDEVDREVFLMRLAELFGKAQPDLLLQILDGLFEAGERDFYSVNRSLFEEAHAIMGPEGASLLAVAAAPVTPLDVLERMTEIMRDEAEAPCHKLLPLKNALRRVRRGLDWVRRYLEMAAPEIWRMEPGSGSGLLLEWLALTGVRLGGWETIRPRLLADRSILGQSIGSVCDYALGLFRYDRATFDEWYCIMEEEILPFLQLHAECISLELTEYPSGGEERSADHEEEAKRRRDRESHGPPTAAVQISYIVETDTGVSPNDQSVRRLAMLRRALPFGGIFRSEGIRLRPLGVQLPVDDSRKAIPRWDLPVPTDIAKNRVLQRIVLAAFSLDTFYSLQQAWYELRLSALRLMEAVGSILQALLDRKRFSPRRFLGPGEELVRDFEEAVRNAPQLHEDALEIIGPLSVEMRILVRKGDPPKWVTAFKYFRRQLWAFFNDRGDRDGRLAALNIREAMKYLPGMHEFFSVLFREQADHFMARDLDARESEAHARVDLLLEGWVLDPLPPGSGRALERLAARRRRRNAEEIERVRAALGALGEAAHEVVYPSGMCMDGPLRILALGIPVRDSSEPTPEVLAACNALVPVADIADFFWLLPLKDGARIGTGAHHISARVIRGEVSADGESSAAALGLMMPTDPPAEVAATLPDLPVLRRPEPKLHQRLSGLAVSMQWYVGQRDAIATVRSDQHPRLRKLGDILRSRMCPSEEEIRESIRKSAEEVAALGVAPDDTAKVARRELLAWLSALDAATASEVIDADSRARWNLDKIAALATSAMLET